MYVQVRMVTGKQRNGWVKDMEHREKETTLKEGLCCSTGLGYLTIWRQHPNGYYDFKEVASKEISAGTEVTVVNADLYNIFSIELPTTVPWALFFQEGRDVIVFRMYGSKVGATNIDPSHKFIINNGTISFSLHHMGDTTCIKTYDTKPQKTCPKQVTFAERGRVIIYNAANHNLVAAVLRLVPLGLGSNRQTLYGSPNEELNNQMDKD
ncbi:hypothetical protein J3A83DRAFT_4189320 [Scleroderma citrinum]